MSAAEAGASGALRPDHRVVRVHRVGALVVAVVIAVFGVLGIVGGLGFFDTGGTPVLGLSSNGLLSVVSLVTALVLVAAAARGGRLASTVMIVVGVLFLVSAFGNLAVLGTSLNLLAFRLPNVFFSIGAGLVLLVLGAYGRVSGKLPDDNPYRSAEPAGAADADGEPVLDAASQLPGSAAERAADQEMAESARAISAGTASDEQRRRMAAVDHVREHAERRRLWMAAGPSPIDQG